MLLGMEKRKVGAVVGNEWAANWKASKEKLAVAQAAPSCEFRVSYRSARKRSPAERCSKPKCCVVVI